MNCAKCGYEGSDVSIVSDQSQITLCSICKNYAPIDAKLLKIYVNEKIDGKILDTFRKARLTISDRTKNAMAAKIIAGEAISKPPKGYKIVNKKLAIDEQSSTIVKKIFEEYIETPNSLSWLAKKYAMTTSGLIKLLKNPVYIGMIKKGELLIQGVHEPIISKELFDKVQEKLK